MRPCVPRRGVDRRLGAGHLPANIVGSMKTAQLAALAAPRLLFGVGDRDRGALFHEALGDALADAARRADDSATCP